MKSTTKIKVLTAFKSLIKNDAAVESAKTTPGYVPIIIAVLATFLPVIPLTVSTSRTYGSQFLKSQQYSLDLYNTDALLAFNEQNYAFALKGGKLQAYKDDVAVTREDESNPIFEYVASSGDKTEIKYQVYYSTRTDKGTKEDRIKEFANSITSTTYLTGTTFTKDSPDANSVIEQRSAESTDKKGYKATYYRPTFVIYYTDGIYTYLTKEGTETRIVNQAGDWKHTADNENLLTRLLTVEGFEGDDLKAKDINGDFVLLRDLDYTGGVLKNMSKLYDESYLTSKQNSLLLYTFVFYGIYLVLVIFMGLMIFLLTRGKKNPMNYMTFWLCLKIAMWSTISPAVLALILGFMLTNFATMFFIILYGLRVMWLSMRQLRPAY